VTHDSQLYINLANNSRLDAYLFTPFAVVTSGMSRVRCAFA
jgi:cyclophilin family peptidyl-prolyl cis-trans isomerase